jgi:lambda repressor-like predicted transcriptional regulator
MTADFTLAVKDKGWQMKKVAERWGVTPRQLSRIAAAPKQIHWDAIAGLPEKGEVLAQSI